MQMATLKPKWRLAAHLSKLPLATVDVGLAELQKIEKCGQLLRLLKSTWFKPCLAIRRYPHHDRVRWRTLTAGVETRSKKQHEKEINWNEFPNNNKAKRATLQRSEPWQENGLGGVMAPRNIYFDINLSIKHARPSLTIQELHDPGRRCAQRCPVEPMGARKTWPWWTTICAKHDLVATDSEVIRPAKHALAMHHLILTVRGRNGCNSNI